MMEIDVYKRQPLYFVWPAVYSFLVGVGETILGMGAIGAGIYGFLNRLLIPTGLHHALNNVFWFETDVYKRQEQRNIN